MQVIDAVLFEPVGCLAEFPAEEFNEIAVSVFGAQDTSGTPASAAYWQVLDLIQASGFPLAPEVAQRVEALELQAVGKAQLYEDVTSALAELQSMQVTLVVASSLSARAVDRFLEQFSLRDAFSAVWTRDTARGIGTAPLVKAMESASLRPAHVMSLADTVDGMMAAKEAGANAIVLFNDYDEGKRLATYEPAGAVVSLHELPDAIRFIAEGAKQRR